jgi:hypothetical protein
MRRHIIEITAPAQTFASRALQDEHYYEDLRDYLRNKGFKVGSLSISALKKMCARIDKIEVFSTRECSIERQARRKRSTRA